LASLTLTFIGLGLMHKAERSISNRFMDAEELVKRLESDRQELVNSDEELRRQTSQFLHDRVQSDLMVIGMKLKSISGKSSPEVEDVLDKAAQRLEKIRTSDIRNLVQILSPNFEAGGLDEALDQLKDQYLKIMDVTIHIEIEPAELDSKELLGIYRIVEQALLNSLIHGPAEKVIVEIEHKNEKEISLVISDNGPGIKAHPIIFGVGSAVIDSWVSILNGRREVTTSPGNGYKLEVIFSGTSVE
jgi:signal transduction histidine kinase